MFKFVCVTVCVRVNLMRERGGGGREERERRGEIN